MILAVWKPKGLTSHDVVERIRRITGEKKVGHAGTLDPFAEGVLVIGIGRDATKKLKNFVGKEKEYLATIKLGKESLTDDEEGEKIAYPNVRKNIRLGEIQEALKKFEGKINQTPPLYSAVKIKGREAYKYARQGEKVDLRPRLVEIKKIEILDYKWPHLKLRVLTGPGVYIRALARDIGRELKTGGYLAALQRTRVDDFTKKECLNIKEILKRN
jgi:tRNA pseudouridine55 synthase